MPKYTVLSPIKTLEGIVSDGEIELDKKDGDDLTALNIVEPVLNEVTKPLVPEGEEKLAIIKAAIAGLNPEDKELFTNAGVAKTTAIEAITGWAVSAAERDAAIAAQ